MKASIRLATNTISQYIRTGANIVLSLISTRLVIDCLGANDYGIYVLIAGIVSMLSFLSNTLTTTTQRYLSYNESKNDIALQREYFINSLAVQVGLGISLIILFIALYPFFFSGFLNIATDRLEASKLVYMLVVIMLFISLFSSPYRAVLITHENIVYISIIDVVDGILKLIIAYALYYFDGNRLIWYSVLTAFISIFNLCALFVYSYIKYEECNFFSLSLIDKKKIKELTSFASWTAYGTLCLFGRIQGISIILNKFFNTSVNAGYGIALTVNSALLSISGALQTALSPQVVTAEGANNRDKMMSLAQIGCKINFILIAAVGIPILFNINYILTLWLKVIPPYTAFFCMILILSNIVDQLSVGYGIAINAMGRIRKFHLIVNTIKFSTVLIIGILMSCGMKLQTVFYFYLLIEMICCILRVVICFSYANYSIIEFFIKILFKLIPSTLVLTGIYWFCSIFIQKSLLILLGEICIATCIYIALVFAFSLSNNEKIVVRGMFNEIISRLHISKSK